MRKQTTVTDEEVFSAIEAHAAIYDDFIRHRQLQEEFGVGTGVIVRAVGRLRAEGFVLPSDGKAGIKPTSFVSRKELQIRLMFQKSYNKKLVTIIDDLAHKLQVVEETVIAAGELANLVEEIKDQAAE